MKTHRRPRGRPRGTEKDDSLFLSQIADHLVRDPSLKPTTAMKRVIAKGEWRETKQTLIRRWQTKWKSRGNILLANAREQASCGREGNTTTPYNSSAIEAFRALTTSSISKLVYGVEPSAWEKLVRGTQNSPWAKLAREARNSPWKDLTSALKVSPTQQLRDHQRLINDAINPFRKKF